MVPGAPRSSSFVSRHQFLIYRLFSLAGLVPVGGYLVIHLLTNATILNGPGAFQTQVDRIHSLGAILPLVEWTFIFIPLLFHAGIGWLIISGAVPNTSSYPYAGNIRYVLQRTTGIIAFFFIVYHVMQLHHLGAWVGGGQFDPEHAASSAAVAIDRALWIKVVYAIGILSCVFHFANGIWTGGITWGIWTSRACSGELVMWSQFLASGWELSHQRLDGHDDDRCQLSPTGRGQASRRPDGTGQGVHRRQDPRSVASARGPRAGGNRTDLRKHFPAGTRGGRRRPTLIEMS